MLTLVFFSIMAMDEVLRDDLMRNTKLPPDADVQKYFLDRIRAVGEVCLNQRA
jgi:hypothetical protein